MQNGDFGDIDGYAGSKAFLAALRTGNVTLNWQRNVALGSIDAHSYYSLATAACPGAGANRRSAWICSSAPIGLAAIC